ncbi:hypothetical protein [Rhizobium leucaenae]|uniref:hypothetical protein n=1 Tax=Rhizobium leucaenae TaxID=29450 RepID=UPI0012E9C5EB|nr:hypothetical protein [Rhizobium leucaenae]
MIDLDRDDFDTTTRRPIAAEQQGGGWLPIESAPKDGTRFLACGPDVPVDFFHWQDFGPEHEGCPVGWRDSFIIVYREEANQVTHWQPLPAPPSPTAAP